VLHLRASFGTTPPFSTYQHARSFLVFPQPSRPHTSQHRMNQHENSSETRCKPGMQPRSTRGTKSSPATGHMTHAQAGAPRGPCLRACTCKRTRDSCSTRSRAACTVGASSAGPPTSARASAFLRQPRTPSRTASVRLHCLSSVCSAIANEAASSLPSSAPVDKPPASSAQRT
jgi:hypothetical protein